MEIAPPPEQDETASSSYIRDVTFPSGYIASQEPTLLSFVAASAGIVPPDPAGPFRYLELGCSFGRTLNALAAANPAAEFVGIDFNPEHIGLARRSAEAGALDNVRYIESAFSEVSPSGLSAFDYIAIHGTYSWLDPESLAAVHKILGQCLNPGGCSYVDHMSLPGKAAIAPVWHFLREVTRDGGDSPSRVRRGMMILSALQQTEVGFLSRNAPAGQVVSSYLDQMRKWESAIRQLAHHALAEHWRPEYFTEIRDRFRDIGLEYAGCTKLAMNETDSILPPDLRAMAQESGDPGVAELIKDFYFDQQQRGYVFVHEPTYDPAAAAAFRRDRLHVVPLHGEATCRRRLANTESQLLDLLPDDVDDVFARLAEGKTTVGDMIAAGDEDIGPAGRLPNVLIELLDRRLAALSKEAAVGGKIAVKTIRPPMPFNANALEAASGERVILASPITGGGIGCPPLVSAVLAYMVREGTSRVHSGVLVEWLRDRPGRYEGRDGVTDAADLSESRISGVQAVVKRDVVPRLVALGVLSGS